VHESAAPRPVRDAESIAVMVRGPARDPACEAREVGPAQTALCMRQAEARRKGGAGALRAVVELGWPGLALWAVIGLRHASEQAHWGAYLI